MQGISKIVFRLIVRIAFLFEPLTPQAISFFLTRRLKELRKKGLISKFKTKIRRLGRFHYKLEIDFDLTRSQVLYALDRWVPNQLKGARR